MVGTYVKIHKNEKKKKKKKITANLFHKLKITSFINNLLLSRHFDIK